MEFDDFKRINLETWKEYLQEVSSIINAGALRVGTGVLLYPNIALFTETEEHFLFELFGATRTFTGLEEKIHRELATLKYLGQFSSEIEKPMFNMSGRNRGFLWLLFSRKANYEALKKRFKFSDLWKTRLDMTVGEGPLFSFSPDFTSCFFNNCLVVNKYEEIYRVKHVLHLRIVSKNQSNEDYCQDLLDGLYKPWVSTNDLLGIHYVPTESIEGYILSGQFANMFLVPELKETTIGKFIERNPIFIERALNCKNFLYEKEFEWIEGNPNPAEKSIKPDLLLERDSGYYDICEFKTAALDKTKITKGEHSRRRFIDYVEEGTAQLANYQDYFTYEKNAEYAASKHSVKVKNPTLYLLVGSYEDSTTDEIEEAARRYTPNYRIIDYDTLNALFLQSYYPVIEKEEPSEDREDTFKVGEEVTFYHKKRKYNGEIIKIFKSGVQIQYSSDHKERRLYKRFSEVKKTQ